MRILFVSLFLSISSLLFAQQGRMHAIIVGDLGQSSGIGGGVQQDINRAYNELNVIASHIGYAFFAEMITEPNRFHRDTILKHARNIPEETDIVIFYYSGHGYCSSEDNMPFLQVEGGLNIQQVLNTIRRSQPRFLLMLSDCCNDLIPKAYDNQVVHRAEANAVLVENLNRLFTSYSGEVVATAARYEQKAYLGPNGSYFTDAFFDSLHFLGHKIDGLLWPILLDDAGALTTDKVKKEKHDLQEPYYTVNIQEL